MTHAAASSASHWEFESFPADFWDPADPFGLPPGPASASTASTTLYNNARPPLEQYAPQPADFMPQMHANAGARAVHETLVETSLIEDELIEAALAQPLDELDVDLISAILDAPEEEEEEDPLAEFFPMLAHTSSSFVNDDPFIYAATGSSSPPQYAQLGSMQPAPSEAAAAGYADLCEGASYVAFGGPEYASGSPTWMDTSMDLQPYLQDDCASTSSHASSTPSPPPVRRAPRHHPYAAPVKPAPQKRQPAFRPVNYGTPLEGETVSDYRSRRDKNNASSAASRRKKQEKVKALKEEAVILERKNIELKARLESLEREVSSCKQLLTAAISS